MSYQVIARKWRPQTFEEVTGQEHITQTLRNALEYDRLHHAYLFSGARGVGKTTTARLLAKALNCHKTKDKPNLTPCRTTDSDACSSCLEVSESRSMDVLEIDAASHTGIDDVRDTIIENINVNPARDRYKVFIIDEVHQLSKAAFNALLKTLEEPPPNVAFVMATTELHKVPETILSRCQQFEFRTIPVAKIFDRLRLIADAETIQIEDAALREIARSGEGSMRDAQSNFDQVISFSDEQIAVKDVVSALGMASAEMLTKAITAIAEHDSRTMLDIVAELVSRGQDMRNFCRDLMAAIRDLTVQKIAQSPELAESSALDLAALQHLAESFSASDLIRIFHSLVDTETRLKEAVQTRYALEIGLIKLVEMRRLVSLENILKRLTALEGGLVAVQPASAKQTVDAMPSAAEEKKTLISEKKSTDDTEDWQKRDLVLLEPPEIVPDFPDEIAVEPEISAIEKKRPAFDLGFVVEMPDRLPPIASEDLEHIDDERLDNAFERALAISGDNLLPLKSVRELYGLLVNETSSSNGSNGTVVALARDLSAYAAPVLEIDNETIELPILSDNPTENELIAYANAHPEVRRVMRVFRAKVISVK